MAIPASWLGACNTGWPQIRFHAFLQPWQAAVCKTVPGEEKLTVWLGCAKQINLPSGLLFVREGAASEGHAWFWGGQLSLGFPMEPTLGASRRSFHPRQCLLFAMGWAPCASLGAECRRGGCGLKSCRKGGVHDLLGGLFLRGGCFDLEFAGSQARPRKLLRVL